ncbi:MAG: hypothetical protein AABY42_02875 [Nitrospirota bacterium]
MNIFEKILENPKNFSVVKKLFYAALVVIILIEIAVSLLHLSHGHFSFDALPGFGSIYGFVSCVIIIVVSKFIGHLWLMKKEGYYD